MNSEENRDMDQEDDFEVGDLDLDDFDLDDLDSDNSDSDEIGDSGTESVQIDSDENRDLDQEDHYHNMWRYSWDEWFSVFDAPEPKEIEDADIVYDRIDPLYTKLLISGQGCVHNQILTKKNLIIAGARFPSGRFVINTCIRRISDNNIWRVDSFSDQQIAEMLQQIKDGNTATIERLLSIHKDESVDSIALPEEVLNACGEDDMAGAYGEKAMWWWEAAINTWHIIGNEDVSPKGNGTCHFFCLYDMEQIEPYRDNRAFAWQTSIKVHEGIRSIVLPDNLPFFLDLKLPQSLIRMPDANYHATLCVVPDTIRSTSFWDNWIRDTGGRFDPIYLAFEKVYLPSSIEFNRVGQDYENDASYRGSFTENEPFDDLEQIYLYGEQPPAKLKMWICSGIFEHVMQGEITFYYPDTWDKGCEPFKERIIREMKLKNPQLCEFSMDHNSFYDFSPEDYERLDTHICTYRSRF